MVGMLRYTQSKELAAVCRWTNLVQLNWREHLICHFGSCSICCWIDVCPDDVRVNVAGIVHLARLEGVKENTIAAAHNGLVAKAISKTEAGSEGLLRTGSRVGTPAVAVEAVT